MPPRFRRERDSDASYGLGGFLRHRPRSIPQRGKEGVVDEALFNTPATAHILGGAVIAAGPEHGVVDHDQRVFGYERLLVCDGSVVPANPGVNPSLTITALAEHAMAAVPDAEASAG